MMIINGYIDIMVNNNNKGKYFIIIYMKALY